MGATRDRSQGYAFLYSEGKFINFTKDWKKSPGSKNAN
jgi:hypothetical protein